MSEVVSITSFNVKMLKSICEHFEISYKSSDRAELHFSCKARKITWRLGLKDKCSGGSSEARDAIGGRLGVLVPRKSLVKINLIFTKNNHFVNERQGLSAIKYWQN